MTAALTDVPVLRFNPRWTDHDRTIVQSHLTRLHVTHVHSVGSGQYLTCFNAAGQIVAQIERGHVLFPEQFMPSEAVTSDRNRRFAGYVPLSTHRPRRPEEQG